MVAYCCCMYVQVQLSVQLRQMSVQCQYSCTVQCQSLIVHTEYSCRLQLYWRDHYSGVASFWGRLPGSDFWDATLGRLVTCGGLLVGGGWLGLVWGAFGAHNTLALGWGANTACPESWAASRNLYFSSHQVPTHSRNLAVSLTVTTYYHGIDN